jgi:hypothetical protein
MIRSKVQALGNYDIVCVCGTNWKDRRGRRGILYAVEGRGRGWGGVGEPEGRSFTKISNMGLYVSVNVSFNCRPLFVRSCI